jgi:radical SAM superfamily enzyme YgiQ (UPF0313 family)
MHVRLIDVHSTPRRKSSFRTLTLPRVAGCTPSDIEVSITDGRVEAIDLDLPADLVGMRARGVAVVAGGTHATAVPNEALQHFDAVLSGEAEGGAWERLLSDCQAGRLGGVYKNEQAPSIAGLPPARVDLLRHPSRYLDFWPIEATRGCPHDCSFCFNSTIHGEGFRRRPVEEVVADANRADSRNLMFMDDNLCGNPKYAKQLFEALIPLKKRLFFQTHLLMAEDPELMRLAQLAGACFVFVGIESFEAGSLKSVSKQWNKVDRYKRYVKSFHDHGIFVSAGLILGLDEDKPDIFDKTIGYLKDIGVDNAAVNLLIPYPGTPFHREMKAQGRILTEDTRHYTGFDVVVQPAKMSKEELEAGFDRVLREFFAPSRYFTSMVKQGMVRRAHVYAVAWWREPRRRTLTSWGRELNRRGGER